jgi:hypothetical protein
LWNSPIPRCAVMFFSKLFSSKTFYRDMWCEVVKA